MCWGRLEKGDEGYGMLMDRKFLLIGGREGGNGGK